MESVPLFAELALYILICRTILALLNGTTREAAFAIVNIASYYLFFVIGRVGGHGVILWSYIPVIIFIYLTMRLFADRKDWTPWLGFFAPILVLVVVRYTPNALYIGFSPAMRDAARDNPEFSAAVLFPGLSYLAFRCSYLVLEVRNGLMPKPTFWQYLGFAFFLPTIAVGPINRYSNHRLAFSQNPPEFSFARSSLRILVGCVKFLFLGNVFNQLTYSGLLLDDHLHHWIDLPIAAIFYYLYLYCNFSGYCDAAIGVAGLIGIPVSENFQDPFASRNMREFWNRWHITLSQYMRDVVFSPLSKFLARLFGPKNVNHAIALTVLVVFLLIGIWHGTGWNYAVFGLFQAVGVITTHYYTIGLKKWLGREGFKTYNENPLIRATAVAVTFCYFAATLFFFANSPADMSEILSELR